jgi:hypothetical protein
VTTDAPMTAEPSATMARKGPEAVTVRTRRRPAGARPALSVPSERLDAWT